jgi:alpha-glucosidase
VPLPWCNEPPANGFGPSQNSWLPQPPAWGSLSVQEQQGRPDSMLELIRAALHARKEHGAFGETAFTWRDDIAAQIAPGRTDVLVSEHGSGEARALVVMVIGDQPVARPAGELLVSSQPVTANEIPGESCAWFSLI